MTRIFGTVIIASILSPSCARMDQREARYDEKACPFCSTNKGVCSYCEGTKKCTFCDGTGTRTTVSPAIESEGIKRSSYEEKCPYCKGTGVCRYCEGSGKCWACEGSAQAGDWKFYERMKKMKESAVAAGAPAASDSAAR